MRYWIGGILLLLSWHSVAGEPTVATRMFEATFESRKIYADPFNDLDVDVIFTKEGQTWRVPTFWRGGNRWTVRFAPPGPGKYTYHLESTDRSNPDLNGHEGLVTIGAYSGTNELLKRGAFRVSRNGRYFEQPDGTPFYWLADAWYTGLSDRLNWDGFQTLTADRKAKGFTVIELAVMPPSNEEEAPIDPGFRNEGGAVWDPGFHSINPRYFDYADRRIEHLLDNGLAPALIGAWRQALAQMGVARMKKHWRYIIARYGAYPVFWIGGGEVYDPPAEDRKPGLPYGSSEFDLRAPGWTDVVRYIRETDPYHHPLTVHEIDPPYDTPLQDESLKDFELLQAGHRGWPSIATAVAQLGMHYARTSVTKPLVVGEIGWEGLANENYETYQRVAFWLSMLNGAAGFTYGNAMTALSYDTDKPFHRVKYSALTWREGMQLPGAYEDGIGAKLLRKYHWEAMTPRPDWVTPGGTTLLEPRSQVSGFDIDLILALASPHPPPDSELPLGEWAKHHGNFHLPYAAGIPRQLRIIYIPPGNFSAPAGVPTILKLEPQVRYHAYYWEPSLGIKFDLGAVQAQAPGELIIKDALADRQLKWINRSGERGSRISILAGLKEKDAVVSVQGRSEQPVGLVLRFEDPDDYLCALYSPKEKAAYFIERVRGKTGEPIGRTPADDFHGDVRFTTEAQGATAILSMTDGAHTVTTPIVDITQTSAGEIGLLSDSSDASQQFSHFEVRRTAPPTSNEHLQRTLFDARGVYRGELTGAVWGNFGRDKHILLNAYRPDQLPFMQDWVLVLEAVN